MKFDPFKDLVLDSYEQEIEDHFDETEPYPKSHPIYKQLQDAAREYRKDHAISLRVNSDVIKSIKTKAKQVGIPYQTLINTLLHQYATGKISIQL